MAETETLTVPASGERVRASERTEVKYATGLSLLGLTSGLAPVDSLMGGLKVGTVALLTGSRIRLEAAESYCIRAQLPAARGGLDGSAYFIDAGNSFDVYLFTALARKYRLDYDSALSTQLLSRAFTVYELRSLIEKSEAVLAARKPKPKLLIISEVFSLFTEDVDDYEAKRVFLSIASSVSDVSKRQGVPILLTSETRHDLITPILEERCTISADIFQGDGWLKSSLRKHPSKPPGETVTETTLRGYNQSALQTEMRPLG